MPRKKGKLQKEGYNYAKSLMHNYSDPYCASKIETWRNRITGGHDVENFINTNGNFNRRQAKQIVIYAKSYIRNMINDYYRQTGLYKF